MDAAKAGTTRIRLRHALAGLQAGVLGALAMILWLMISSTWIHRSIWLVPNLFATTFFGTHAYRNEFLRTSSSGIALIVAIYGLCGLFWGLFWRDNRRPFMTLTGALTGVLVYMIFFDLIWTHLNPLIPLYSPDRQLQIGHVLWGMVLARSPNYVRRIAQTNMDAPISQPASGEPEKPLQIMAPADDANTGEPLQ